MTKKGIFGPKKGHFGPPKMTKKFKNDFFTQKYFFYNFYQNLGKKEQKNRKIWQKT